MESTKISALSQLSVQVDQIRMTTSDDYILKGYSYQLQTKNIRARLILAGATGVPQAFYRRFAEYMTQFGYQVITFDYRGIGESKPASLKGFEMSYLDWGKVDLSTVVDAYTQDDLPLFMVGHSYGGHALGLLPNHHKITAFYCFGTGTGWAGYMPKIERLKVRFMWNVVFPLMVKQAGYLPWSKLNMGEDLPLNAYQMWRKWCKNPHYCFDDPEYADELKALYQTVKTPMYAAVATDDAWALPISRDVFMSYYKNADLHLVDLRPQDYKMAEIGHMGYFRKNAQPIWEHIVHTFDAYFKKQN